MSKYLHQKYRESKFFETNKILQIFDPPPAVKIDNSERPGILRQFGILVSNEFGKSIKEPNAFRTSLIQVVLIGVIMGIIYWDLGHDQASIQNRAGALFFLIANALFGGLTGPFRNVLIEQRIFFYHNQEGLYSTIPYCLAKFICVMPEIFIANAIFVSIFYFMVRLQLVATNIILFYVIDILVGWTTLGFGSFILYIFDDPAVAQTIFPIFFVPMMIFSGFYANSNSTPIYFIWAPYLSIIKYGFNCVANIEFTNNNFTCTASELKDYGGACPYTKGEQWLNFRGLNQLTVWQCVIILIAFMFAYFIIGVIRMKYRVLSKKN